MTNKSDLRSRQAKSKRSEKRRVRRNPVAWIILLVFVLQPPSFILSSASAQQAKPAGSPAAADAAPRGPVNYDSFKLIHTRNVFDPDRRPVRPSNASASVPTSRSDYLALTGTLLDADKSYAFFSGSRTDFNKVLTVGDKIANAKVTQITPVDIVVEREGRPTTVRVGQTVPLDGKSAPGAPPVSVAEVASASSDRPASAPGDAVPGTAAMVPGNTAPAAPGTRPPSGSKEDMIRKMMERRQQELK